MDQIRATITHRDGQTRILVQHDQRDLMIAKLGPLHGAHRYALRSLIEGIALWFHEQVHVVLCVDEELLFDDELVDTLGIGVETPALQGRRGPRPAKARTTSGRETPRSG